MKIKGFILGSALVLASMAVVHADVNSDLNTEASKMNTLASSQGTSKGVDKISSQFSDFLGADSKSVVTGLRNGTPITLTRTAPTPGSTTTTTTTAAPTTTTTTITPPTGKMGFGNVFISLALAKQQLAQMGITQPTPEQLNAALVGGTFPTGTTATGAVTTSEPLRGILAMRSEHMGWGKIAHELGFKLGPVVSSLKHTNQTMTTTPTASTSGGTTATGSQVKGGSQSGIVSGSGKSHGNSSLSPKSGSGEGIVSASGNSAGSGNAYGHGKGIVTGGGQAAGGTSGITTGGGHGNSSGRGNGHNK
jgi:hypothetical protein